MVIIVCSIEDGSDADAGASHIILETKMVQTLAGVRRLWYGRRTGGIDSKPDPVPRRTFSCSSAVAQYHHNKHNNLTRFVV